MFTQFLILVLTLPWYLPLIPMSNCPSHPWSYRLKPIVRPTRPTPYPTTYLSLFLSLGSKTYPSLKTYPKPHLRFRLIKEHFQLLTLALCLLTHS